jgi:hypothetical protein
MAGCNIKPKDLFDIIEPEMKQLSSTDSVVKEEHLTIIKNSSFDSKSDKSTIFQTNITKKNLQKHLTAAAFV